MTKGSPGRTRCRDPHTFWKFISFYIILESCAKRKAFPAKTTASNQGLCSTYSRMNHPQGGDPGEIFQKIETLPQQQASWIGLSASRQTRDDGFFRLQDYLLWKTLTFAVDLNDYTNLTLVNKEWNGLVRKLLPSLVKKLYQLMKKPCLLEEDLHVWTDVLVALENRTCLFYRGDGTGNSRRWPYLQPQFSICFMSFVYKASIQRDPLKHDARLYKITCDQLVTFSRATVDLLWDAVKEDGQSSAEKLESIVNIAARWHSYIETVIGLGDYLNQYYVKYHSLATLLQVAEQALVGAWTGSLQSQDLGSVQNFLHDIGQVSAASLTHDQLQLFLDARNVCDALRGLLPNPLPASWVSVCDTYSLQMPVIDAILETACEMKQKTKEAAPDANKPIVIRYGGNSTEVHPGCLFLTSSTFLKNLHLQPGDEIKLDIPVVAMEKALEFYQLYNETPCPQVTTPLRTMRGQELFGETFWEFLDTMSLEELFGVVSVASMLGQKELLDAGCFTLTLMLRDRSPEEMRQLFGIHQG